MGAIDSKKSGQNSEEAWLEEILCNSTCNLELVNNIDINDSELSSQNGNNYINVSPSQPGYFLLKFGIGNDKTNNTDADMFLLKNNSSLEYLVWSDQQLIDEGLPDTHVNSISHYAITQSQVNVPEPGVVSLLGIALAGAGVTRRRRK